MGSFKLVNGKFITKDKDGNPIEGRQGFKPLEVPNPVVQASTGNPNPDAQAQNPIGNPNPGGQRQSTRPIGNPNPGGQVPNMMKNPNLNFANIFDQPNFQGANKKLINKPKQSRC